MKILKIFGIVVGIHVFALVLIFANPGCSATTKPAPSPTDTVITPAPANPPAASAASAEPAPATSAITFHSDAPAATAPVASTDATVRFVPTRPGTPAAGTLVAEPVTDVTPATTYTVKSGDSLSAIAKKHRVTIAQLTAANGISAGATLRAGQKLVIPGKPASASAAATANPAAAQGKTAETVAARPAGANGTIKHTVKSGETLGGIARTYGVKAGDIAVANNISDPAKIRPGMELTIPGWESPSAKRGSTKASTTKSPASAPPAAVTPEPTPAASSQPAAQPPAATPTPQVPLIRIDDSPVAPAPKGSGL